MGMSTTETVIATDLRPGDEIREFSTRPFRTVREIRVNHHRNVVAITFEDGLTDTIGRGADFERKIQ